MGKIAQFQQQWQERCQQDFAAQSLTLDTTLIVQWLLGEDLEQKATAPTAEWLLFEKGVDYRYRVLLKYLKLLPSRRFGQLLRRLGQVVTLRQQIRTWVALSRDRRRTVYDVLEEVIQEMLQRDHYLRHELQWIQTCAPSPNLQSAFLCTVLEEYCLRPIQNQPLISYRFVNLMRRYQRAGVTNLPADQTLKLLSTELETNNSEQTLNLLDNEAIARHQSKEDLWQEDLLRQTVIDNFLEYLKNNVKDPLALPWFKLYLQGKTQEAIAQELQIPIQQSYRLKDKVKYHAIHNFAIKTNPEIVAAWLQTSLTQNRLGLTPQQWQKFQAQLTPEQLQILMTLQQQNTDQKQPEALDYKTTAILRQWSQIYLIAQNIRG